MSELQSTEITKKYPYRRFILGQITSLLGSEVIGYVLGWYITLTYMNAFYLAMVMFLQFFPRIFISPIAGVFADRYDRKKIILFSDMAQAVITATLAVIYIIGFPQNWEIGVIYTFIVLRTIFQAIQRPAVSAVLPSITPAEKLSRLNGILQLSGGLISLMGPLIALAFLKIPFLDTFDVLWIDVITFVFAFMLLLSVPIPMVQKTKIEHPQELKGSKFIRDFKEGISVTKEIKGITAILLLFAVANFLITPVNTLSDLLIVQVHGGGVDELTFISIFFSTGLILGSILVSLIKKWNHQTFWMFVTVIGLFSGLIIVALAPYRNFWLMGAGGFVTTFGIPIFSTIVITTMQLVVPNHKMGRFMGFMNAIMSLVTPIGYLISGTIAQYTGIIPLFIGSSVLAIILMVVIWTTSNIGNLEKIVREKLNQNQLIKKEQDRDSEQKYISQISEPTISESKDP